MLHTYYATKDIYPLDQTITKDTKPLVIKGEVALVIDTPLSLDAAIRATMNGTATLDAPKLDANEDVPVVVDVSDVEASAAYVAARDATVVSPAINAATEPDPAVIDVSPVREPAPITVL